MTDGNKYKKKTEHNKMLFKQFFPVNLFQESFKNIYQHKKEVQMAWKQ